MTEQTPVIRVVAAIIEYDGKYLACRRAPHKESAGLWEFPGGKIEPAESPEDALVREILEELNVPVFDLKLFDDSTTTTEFGKIQLISYLAAADLIPIGSSDHDQLRLVSKVELEHLHWAAPDLPAVRKLLSGSYLIN